MTPTIESESNAQLFDLSIAKNEEDVNRQYSLNAPTVSKRDVVRDLQAILNRGGDPRELQQYVSRLEQSSGRAEQTGANRYQTRENRYQTGENRTKPAGNGTAREILQAAHSQGLGVEEYLRWNPEEFEKDGRWRTEALEALRMEQGGRRYSLNTGEENTESQARGISREYLPSKARNYLRRTESTLLNRIGETLCVTVDTAYRELYMDRQLKRHILSGCVSFVGR